MAPAYAGIGSRRAPAPVLARMRAIAAGYARAGWTLRTGGSPGADQAFLAGALGAGGEVELYLPWPCFERGALPAPGPGVRVWERPSRAAQAASAPLHPAWARLDGRARALLARDAHEVLGAGLARPAAFVLCWTADGSLDGAGVLGDGTGQALRLASRRGVPVFNLRRGE